MSEAETKNIRFLGGLAVGATLMTCVAIPIGVRSDVRVAHRVYAEAVAAGAARWNLQPDGTVDGVVWITGEEAREREAGDE